MTQISLRGIKDETLRALRLQAKENRRSMEAEIRAILDAALLPGGRLKLGTALANLGRATGGLDLPLPREKTVRPE